MSSVDSESSLAATPTPRAGSNMPSSLGRPQNGGSHSESGDTREPGQTEQTRRVSGQSHQRQQQSLGMGRPMGEQSGYGSVRGRPGEALGLELPEATDRVQRTQRAASATRANLPMSAASAVNSPNPQRPDFSPRADSIMSYNTEDEGEDRDPARYPRTALPTFGDQTPRGGFGGVGGSSRGYPRTAVDAQFSSADRNKRPDHLARHNTATTHPVSHPANPSSVSRVQMPSTSRSASTTRSRPAIAGHASVAQMPVRSRTMNEDDDSVIDRGAELIRQRQKERRAKKREKEARERERGRTGGDEEQVQGTSAPSTGLPGDTPSAQQARAMASRSVSRNRVPSSVRHRDTHPIDGYFGTQAGTSLGVPGTPGSTTDGLLSPRHALRPPSIFSTATDDEDEAREQQEILNEVVAEIVGEEVAAASNAGDDEEVDADDDDDDDDSGSGDGEEGLTMKDRQDAINIEHPFGLPIWKPALYRKSRTVTRNAESALHSIPSAAAERHLLPGNILWIVLFGWWLAGASFLVALAVSFAEVLAGGRGGYGKTVRGLAWYIYWPFGKYVEGEGAPESDSGDDHEDGGEDEHNDADEERGRYGIWNGDSPLGPKTRQLSEGAASNMTIRPSRQISGPSTGSAGDQTSQGASRREPTISFARTASGRSTHTSATITETTPLFQKGKAFRRPRNRKARALGRVVYWPLFVLIVAPCMLIVCVLCWGMIITIPMAKLVWELLNLLYYRPLEINFRPAPKVQVSASATSAGSRGSEGSPSSEESSGSTTLHDDDETSQPPVYRRARLTAGQVAPTDGPKSTVLLCTYRAVGLQYYKYTVGGVNILFINLLPLVFFTIVDGLLLLPMVERMENAGKHPSPFLRLITAQALIFVLGMASVIPLSYFIGMAVASISAQSSIGMGAVINATFGSVIEIILYSIALTQGKGRLVEGSIVGSILAGVLLMPGASMCSGALKRKEQRFNAKSAGVTSTMLIMAIIGTLTPTMFYQTYGTFELHCEGCPDEKDLGITVMTADKAWQCRQCYYEHPDPASDPFYQEQVKSLMYACAGLLLFSYLIGLWFSLRTHASQIWQNPQQLMKAEDATHTLQNGVRQALLPRMTPQAVLQHVLPIHQKDQANAEQRDRSGGSIREAPTPRPGNSPKTGTLRLASAEEGLARKDSDRSLSRAYGLPQGYTPFLEGMARQAISGQGSQGKDGQNPPGPSHITPMRLPSSLTTEDFTRAVAVATVSALRHQGSIIGGTSQHGTAHKVRPEGHQVAGPSSAHTAGHGHPTGHGHGDDDDEGEAGGHGGPSWNRVQSTMVLLGCTVLYAALAEVLVDVVDVAVGGLGIDEKFLGLTLFALLPNTAELVSAISFSMAGNISLSMEIGSAYALQVCLLQIPAMVAFSALYDPKRFGDTVDTFTLIFPRWDVIAIILAIFLLTYTYIEARSNYHRGSILLLAYLIFVLGFYYAPVRGNGDTSPGDDSGAGPLQALRAGWTVAATALWG